MKKFLLTICTILSLVYGRAQTLTTSNLPIVRINTGGVTIPDEPKITATMQVIWSPTRATNTASDTLTGLHYNGKIGIERRGSTSQSISPKKPYSVELRTAAGADSSFALLGMPKEEDWAFVAPYSDKTLLRDALMYNLGSKIFPYSPKTRFVELVLNNAYQGVYVVTEKIKRDKNRVDISKIDITTRSGDSLTGGYILKLDKLTATSGATTFFTSRISNNGAGNNKSKYLFHYPDPDEINFEQRTYIQNFILSFEDVMNSPNYADSANGYGRYISDTSFVDFFLMNELARNVDGYRLSSYLYKDKNSVDPRLKMGPLWDFNIGLGNADYCNGQRTDGWAFQFNTVCDGDSWLVPFYWQKLFDAPRFRALIKSRWQSFRRGELTNTKITASIDSMSNLLAGAQARNFQKWAILNSRVWPNPQINSTYSGEITYLKNWLQARLIWLDGEIDQLSTSNTGGGTNPIANTDLLRVFPNPSPQTVRFQYELGIEQTVRLDIYNAMGQFVDSKEIRQVAGKQELVWDSQRHANGLYFYKISKGNAVWKEGKFVIEK